MVHFIYLVIFHLKVIIYQNFNLTYIVIALKNIHLCYDNHQTPHGSQTYSNRMESQYLISITNFL
jgi:hypothetical protein